MNTISSRLRTIVLIIYKDLVGELEGSYHRHVTGVVDFCVGNSTTDDPIGVRALNGPSKTVDLATQVQM